MKSVPSENNRITTIITACLISVFFIGAITGLVVFPAIKKLYEKKDSLERERYFSENTKAELLKKQDYESFQRKIVANKEIIDSCLIGNESVVSLIEKIEKIARESGNEISIAQYQPPKKKKQPVGDEAEDQNKSQAEETDKNMSFLQIDLTGEYANFLHFLYKLENMDYAFRIDYIQTKNKKKSVLNLREEQKGGSLETKLIIGFKISK